MIDREIATINVNTPYPMPSLPKWPSKKFQLLSRVLFREDDSACLGESATKSCIQRSISIISATYDATVSQPSVLSKMTAEVLAEVSAEALAKVLADVLAEVSAEVLAEVSAEV